MSTDVFHHHVPAVSQALRCAYDVIARQPIATHAWGDRRYPAAEIYYKLNRRCKKSVGGERFGIANITQALRELETRQVLDAAGTHYNLGANAPEQVRPLQPA